MKRTKEENQQQPGEQEETGAIEAQDAPETEQEGAEEAPEMETQPAKPAKDEMTSGQKKLFNRLKNETIDMFGKGRKHGHLTQKANFSDRMQIVEFAARRGLNKMQGINTNFVKAFFETKIAEGKSNSTLEGYATQMREIASRIGKNNIVPRTNNELGIGRTAVERNNPKESINADQYAKAKAYIESKGEWLGVALQLREALGLRMMESIRTKNVYVDERKNIYLHTLDANGKDRTIVVMNEKAGQRLAADIAGTKGGRPRTLTIDTKEQRDAIDRLIDYQKKTGRESIMPPDLTLEQAYNRQKNVCTAAGMTKENNCNNHILRHLEAKRIISVGATPREAMERLGHSDVRKLKAYVR